MSSKQLSKLKNLYQEALQSDKAIFAEQRSNILLKNGEHYKKSEAVSFAPSTRAVTKK